MEDVLEIYKRPYNSSVPVICMDEQPTQLIKETRMKIAVEPGKPERVDYEYERNGTAANFMFTEPLGSWRKVNVRQRKTSIDWAYEIKELLDKDYSQAQKVILVCDNLNTHKIASLYEAFEPKDARQLAERFEIHYTPKHGSWLNVAEIELSVFTKQCRIDEYRIGQHCNKKQKHGIVGEMPNRNLWIGSLQPKTQELS